jgi:hypothetical protein
MFNPKPQSTIHKAQRGQGLVEAAISIPVLLIIAIGIFFIGNVLRTSSALNSAAAAGALHASLGHGIGSVESPCDDNDTATLTVLETVCNSLRQQMVAPEDVEINIAVCGKNRDADDPEASICEEGSTPLYGDVVYVQLQRKMCFGNGLWFGCVPVRSQGAAVVQREMVQSPAE